jgi:pyrroloquinoline quinone biosynthesis protein D
LNEDADMELDSQSRPRLPRGVKLKRDEVRARWTLLAPERVFEVDDTAAAVLQLCEGERDVGAIVAELARRYNAPHGVIEKDVIAMLGGLRDKGALDA